VFAGCRKLCLEVELLAGAPRHLLAIGVNQLRKYLIVRNAVRVCALPPQIESGKGTEPHQGVMKRAMLGA